MRTRTLKKTNDRKGVKRIKKVKFNKTVKIIRYKRSGSKKGSKGGSKSKKITLKKVNCSPKDKSEMNDYTCYKNKDLHKMRNLWNARHPEQPIHTNSPKEIHHYLALYMKNACNKESCWLKQNFVDGNIQKKILTDSFAPEAPKEWKKNPNEWLSNVDIHKVMKQYEKAYKCFDFIGPSPIDFDTKKIYGNCVWDELCHFNLKKEIDNGKFKIGVVFNTDTHDKSGEHWISLFINVKKAQIFFFDSAGDKAPNEIKVLVDRVIDQGKQLPKPIHFKFDENYPVDHQKGNTECGVYSLFFIIYMLEDKVNTNYLKTHIIPDKSIEKYRRVFFNPEL